MDDKVRVLGILEAVETMLGEGVQPRRTLYLAFGHDEEVGGARGATRLAALLHSRGIQLEYVLDEGLVITEGILPSVSAPVALVGIAEKGFVNIELTIQSEGGHASMPPPHTAVGTLTDIRRIHGTDERISIENYAQIVGFYVQLIRNSAL
jgi:carboxypeptidase PM20D1